MNADRKRYEEYRWTATGLENDKEIILRARIAELEEALRPFAEISKNMDDCSDEMPLQLGAQYWGVENGLFVRDFNRASVVLYKSETK